MRRCFVIQPLDKGPFDKRYHDVISPAVKAADFEPYRVDLDPSVSMPIESIQQGIESSDACVADISVDNPNVWFEVGYAIAVKKPVIFICDEERRSKFPFDVQHRMITKYLTSSPRDFEALSTALTQRLKASRKSGQELVAVSKLSPTQETEGLKPHEVAALIVLMENHLSPDSRTASGQISESMRRAGFTEVAVSIALHGLVSEGYVRFIEGDDFREYSGYALNPKGVHWILDNQNSLVLTEERQPKAPDNDIPF
jgi:nucleoside 2-deoxyribosyltransferase